MLPGNSHPKEKSVSAPLSDLIKSSSGAINAAAAMTADGHIISSYMQAQTDEDRFSAMCASLLALADKTTEEVSIGKMRQVMIVGTAGTMLLNYAGTNTVLALQATPSASLGKVILEAKKTAQLIEQIIDG